MQISSVVVGPHTVVTIHDDLDYAVANELGADLFDLATCIIMYRHVPQLCQRL